MDVLGLCARFVFELEDLAERIWMEGARSRSAFSWKGLAPASVERVIALRSSLLALRGSDFS
ncbi:hypothetical protein H8S47_02885 [Sphingomonas sp. DOAB1063]|uniref:Uncharacterized protein n=1 Tax=Sphingomonas albertensis TaxID=2762591 RepID=A0ABR7AJJ4_9SPHN|nr:hypothetical protein [Sphingomonas albertensis]